MTRHVAGSGGCDGEEIGRRFGAELEGNHGSVFGGPLVADERVFHGIFDACHGGADGAAIETVNQPFDVRTV
jgi:hypothetical protein